MPHASPAGKVATERAYRQIAPLRRHLRRWEAEHSGRADSVVGADRPKGRKLSPESR